MAEGTEVGTAYVSIVPSAAGFGSKLQQLVTGEANQAGTKAGQALGAGITGQASGIAKGVAGIFAAVGAARFLKGSLAEAEDAARVGRLTDAVIKSTGGAAGVTADQVEKLAGSLSKMAGVDDEVIQSAENVLLTFTRVSGQIFPAAAKAALDLSAALGSDLQSATIQLGKALNDPVAGMTALTRSGVSFTEQQKDQIKALQQSGDLLGAQKIILEEVNREFGGAAAANATATARLGVAMGNLQESLGTALLPTVNAASAALTGLLTGFTALPGPVQTVAGALAGLGAASVAIGLLAPKLATARTELEGMGRAGTFAAKGLGLLGKAGLGLAIAGGVAEGVNRLGDAILRLSEGPPANLNALTKALVDLGVGGAATGELADELGASLGELGEKAAEAAGPSNPLARLGHNLARVLNPSIKDSERDIDALDKALAGLASSGHADVAASAVERLTTAIRRGPGGDAAADKFVGELNDYKEALAGVDVAAILTGQSVDGAGNSIEGSGDKAEEAAKKWEELHGELEDLVSSDWSKQLASDLTSALDPMERFVTTSSKNIADLKTSVDSASADLADARAQLDKLRGAGITDPVEAFLARGSGATEAQINAAQDKIDKASAALAASQKKLAEAQKGPIATIRDNLTANLNQLTSWLGNITKLSKGGHETLAKDLAALGPDASGAVAEAAGASPAQLDQLEGLFVKRDKLIADAASGAFELNVDQVGRPGETLAQIIADRYQKTLSPKFKDATLAALNEATAALLGQGPVGGIEGAFPTTEPGPGEARTPISSTPALVGVAAPATTTKSVVVNVGGPVPDPTLLGKAIAWEI